MRVSPRTIPGILQQQNYTAIGWGWQNYLAYASQATVVVVDPKSMQVMQTLTRGTASVKKVCWSRDSFHRSLAAPYLLRLAAVDEAGLCVVWDVCQACILAEFSLGGKPVKDIKWLSTRDSCRDLMAVLMSSGQLCIWNADTGIKVKSFALGGNFVSMSLDPFNVDRILLLSSDSIVLMEGFSPDPDAMEPKRSKYHFCEVSQERGPGLGRGSPQIVKMIVPAASSDQAGVIPLSECLQLVFSPVQRNHILLLFKRFIFIVDLEVSCAVSEIVLEKSTSQFVQLYPCSQRDVLYVLHENGSVSVRVRNPLRVPTGVPASPRFGAGADCGYSSCAFSEPLRLSRTVHVAGMAVSPSSEVDLAVVVADGRVMILQVDMEVSSSVEHAEHPPLYVRMMRPSHSLSGPLGEGVKSNCKFCLDYMVSPNWMLPPVQDSSLVQLSDECKLQPVRLKLSLLGLYQGIGVSPTCFKMGPPVTTKNWSFHVPYLAVGLTVGNIQILDLLTGQVYKELSVHTCPVGGVEWINLSSVVSFSSTIPNTSGRVKNELAITELDTGTVHHLSRNKQGESTPITSIRVSPQKCYLIVVFQAKPMELWSVDSVTLLKELSGIQIIFSVVEWVMTGLNRPPAATKVKADPEDVNPHSEPEKSGTQYIMEYLCLYAKDGSIYQLSVEGNKLKNLTQTPMHFGVGSITAVSWKPELMACGTSDGEIVFYDLRNAHSRIVPTSKGAIKKVKFAPGKGNLKLLILYNNRLDIRNVLEEGVVAQIKWGKDQPSVESAEWANSDKPVLLMSGGSIQIWDLSLKQCQSPMLAYRYSDPMFCPQATLPQASLRLKTLLQHQSWTGSYTVPSLQMISRTSDTSNEETLMQFATLSEDCSSQLQAVTLGPPERFLHVANLFGDEFEYNFWKVALYFLSRERIRLNRPNYKAFKEYCRRTSSTTEAAQVGKDTQSTSSLKNVVDLLLALDELDNSYPENNEVFSSQPSAGVDSHWSPEDIKTSLSEADKEHSSCVPGLDFSHDFLLTAETFKKMELHRTCVHDTKRVSYELTKKCVDRLLFLGQVDRAVQLLLETDSSHPGYYSDSLKACLSTAVQCSATSQSTVKLVATNLIANSRLVEGAQLLCVTGKGLDACRYMQTYGEWALAAWLAKICLPEKECGEVLTRWVDHLASSSVNQKKKAILLLLSLGHFERVLEILFGMRYFDVAALFADCLHQWGIITDQASVLVESVYLEYAQYLQSLGLNSAFRFYCSKAGAKGKLLMDQFITYSSAGIVNT